MAEPRVTMEVGNDGVAVITMSNPPVNDLVLPILDGVKEKFSQAMMRDDVKAIVLTGDGGRFSGVFDMNVFQTVQQTGDLSLLPADVHVSVDLVLNTIENAKKPAVAAVQGLALGGGLELAMGCHARISTPGAQLGNPELTIGIIPGFGATQRLPRLVGLPKAIEMLLSSKFITSEEGNKLGLIDAIVPHEELLKVSRKWASEIADGCKPRIVSLQRTDKLGSLSEANEIINFAREQAKQAAPNMPQNQACLDVIQHGVFNGGYSGLLKENEVFKELVLSDTSKSLVEAFFAQSATSEVKCNLFGSLCTYKDGYCSYGSAE